MNNPNESTCTPLPDLTTATAPFAILNTDDLNAAAQASLPWLWHGFLAPGNITLLTSQWKSGKTTLIAVLLSRLNAGGQLAGLPVLPEGQRDKGDSLRKVLAVLELCIKSPCWAH